MNQVECSSKPTYFTTRQIASAYQVSKRWVEMLCAKNGVRRHGRAYLIDMYDAQRLAKELYGLSEDTSVIDEYRAGDQE